MLPAVAVLALLALGLGWNARRGLDVDTATPLAAAGGLTALVGAFVLAVFGALLKATTHHRGLGGVTFSVVGLLAVLGVAAFVGVWAGAVSRRRKGPWIERGGALLALLAGLFLLARGGGVGGGALFALVPIAGAVGWLVGAASAKR